MIEVASGKRRKREETGSKREETGNKKVIKLESRWEFEITIWEFKGRNAEEEDESNKGAKGTFNKLITCDD